MASVTGMTVEKIEEELDKMIVSISVDPDTGEMFAHPRDGDPISAGPAIPASIAVEAAYPVGSIYINAGSATNPATLLGVGTWTRYGKGRTIVSLDEAQTEFDSLGETAGAKTVALSTAELPTHHHSITHTHPVTLSYVTAAFDQDGADGPAITSLIWGNAGAIDRVGDTGASSAADSGDTGTGTAHNNLQPYIVAYVWQRTS